MLPLAIALDAAVLDEDSGQPRTAQVFTTGRDAEQISGDVQAETWRSTAVVCSRRRGARHRAGWQAFAGFYGTIQAGSPTHFDIFNSKVRSKGMSILNAQTGAVHPALDFRVSVCECAEAMRLAFVPLAFTRHEERWPSLLDGPDVAVDKATLNNLRR